MKKYRFILFPLLVIIIIALMTSLFALPKIKSVVEFRGQLNRDKEKLSRLTKKAAFLEGLDSYELETKVQLVEKALPSRKVVAEILVVLGSISNETGIFFDDFDISAGEMIPVELEEILFKATFSGPKEKIKNFFERINHVMPVMKVISFNIKDEKAILKIESYFSPFPKTLGKVDMPLAEISRQEKELYEKIIRFESYEKTLPSVPTGKENIFF